jgi:hypothetical protein
MNRFTANGKIRANEMCKLHKLEYKIVEGNFYEYTNFRIAFWKRYSEGKVSEYYANRVRRWDKKLGFERVPVKEAKLAVNLEKDIETCEEVFV